MRDNFKTPEDLAKSYDALESKLGQLGNEKSAAEKRAAELEQRLTALESQSQTHVAEEQTEWLQEALETRPLETIAWLTQQAAAQAVEQALAQQPKTSNHEIVAYAADQNLVGKYDDYEQYKPKIAEMVQEDPSLLAGISETSSLADVQRSLERVYKVAKADDLLTAGGQIAQQAEAARAAKNAAQTLSGASGREEDATAVDAARQAILDAARGGDYASFRGV